MYLLDKRSLKNLQGVHPSLVQLMKTAILSSPFPFIITEGLRSTKRPQQLFQEGKTKTLHSYHLGGRAVDIAVLVNNCITWKYPYYEKVAKHILTLAKEKNLSITWGGTWKTFVDACHFQLEE